MVKWPRRQQSRTSWSHRAGLNQHRFTVNATVTWEYFLYVQQKDTTIFPYSLSCFSIVSILNPLSSSLSLPKMLSLSLTHRCVCVWETFWVQDCENKSRLFLPARFGSSSLQLQSVTEDTQGSSDQHRAMERGRTVEIITEKMKSWLYLSRRLLLRK